MIAVVAEPQLTKLATESRGPAQFGRFAANLFQSEKRRLASPRHTNVGVLRNRISCQVVHDTGETVWYPLRLPVHHL
jgi:hypothetical protein